MAQITDVKTNFQNNNTYWKNVADAIEYCGEDSTEGVATYPDKIKNIKNSLDTEINELENTKLEYESNFSDINSAIISKGQTPSGGYDTYAEAILNIGDGEVTINLQEKSIEPTTNEQTVRPDSGYNGLSSVVVGAVNLQSKQVEPTLSENIVEPDSEFLGLSSVVVGAVTSDIDNNIVAENIKAGVSILGVEGTYEGSGGSGGTEPVLQNKEIEPITEQQIISADSGYDGLDTVTIKAVTSDIDKNIVADNIKSGVTILGVEGTYEASGTESSLEINDAQYICYNNARSIDDIISLLKNCTKFNYAFNGAVLTDGEDYVIDMSSIATSNSVDHAFYQAYGASGTEGISIKLILGNTIAGGKMLERFNQAGTNKLIDILFEKKSDDITYSTLEYLCYYLYYVRSIDFGNIFDNIQDLSLYYMFNNINTPDLDLDLSKLDFSKVSNAEYMFNGAKLKSLKFNDLNIVNISDCDCDNMFYSSYIPLSEIVFNISNCHLTQAFAQIDSSNTSLTINISDTSDGADTYKQSVFKNSKSLVEINTDLDYWELYGDTTNLFKNCSGLTKIPKIKKYVNNNNNGSLSSMYYGCTSLEEIQIEIIHTDDNTATGYTYQNAFYNNNALKRILGNLDMSYVTNVNSMFSGCSSLVTIETTGSFGGKSTTNSLTLDLSASTVFDATSFINSLASNDSGKTRIIKLNTTVLSALSDETKALATTKNYTLQ